MSNISISKEQFEKLAQALLLSGKMLKEAKETSMNLLSDNENLTMKIKSISDEQNREKRQNIIQKIAHTLEETGNFTPKELNEKLAELDNLDDSFLSQFEKTISGIGGIDKEAEGTVSTFSFLSKDIPLEETSPNNKKPSQMRFE